MTGERSADRHTAPVRSFSFPKRLRLRTSAEFQRVSRGGRKLTTRNLVVVYSANELAFARFGLAVSRKVGNAVTRNRVKRWLREAIRTERDGLTAMDVVLIAKPSTAATDANGIRAEVAEAVGRMRGVT